MDSLGAGRVRGKITTFSVSVLQKSQCCGFLQFAGREVYSKHFSMICNIYILINLQWPLNPVSVELQSFPQVQQGHISGAFLYNELTFPRRGIHAAEPLHTIWVISPACWGLVLYEKRSHEWIRAGEERSNELCVSHLMLRFSLRVTACRHI